MPTQANKKIIASIDFGTNTFHVIIAELDSAVISRILGRKRWFAFLNRSKDDFIIDDAVSDAKNIAHEIAAFIKPFAVSETYGVATEVFRAKSNGKTLLNDISRIISAQVDLLSGQEEAKMSFLGVNALLDPAITNYLLVDIGGGSTEFIRAYKSEMLFNASFKVGLSMLEQHIDFKGQLTEHQIDKTYDFLDLHLKELFAANQDLQLILNGGSAELFHKILPFQAANEFTQVFGIEDVSDLCRRLLYSEEAERANIDWIPDARNYLMPVFLMQVQYLIERFKVTKVVYTPASIKEGLIMHKN